MYDLVSHSVAMKMKNSIFRETKSEWITLTNCQTWQKRSSNLSKIIIWQINNCNFWNLMVIYQTPMTNTFDEFHAWVKAYHNQPAVAQPSLLLSKSNPINGFAIEQIKKNNTILPFLIVLLIQLYLPTIIWALEEVDTKRRFQSIKPQTGVQWKLFS